MLYIYATFGALRPVYVPVRRRPAMPLGNARRAVLGIRRNVRVWHRCPVEVCLVFVGLISALHRDFTAFQRSSDRLAALFHLQN